MDREKRKGNSSIPDNLKEIMSEAQVKALSGIGYSGWELRFLRRPLFQEPEIVLHNPDNGRIGILDRDGSIKLHNIKVRDLDIQAFTPSLNAPLVWTK